MPCLHDLSLNWYKSELRDNCGRVHQRAMVSKLRWKYYVDDDENEGDAGDDDNGNSDGDGDVGGDKVQKLEINS